MASHPSNRQAPPASTGAIRLVTRPGDLRAAVAELPRPLVLVPTMGALHKGHLALVDHARAHAGAGGGSRGGGGTVAVSIFVNPTQFGPGEDLAAYPRDLGADLALCRDRGVDLVFAPDEGLVYPADVSTVVTERVLSRGLCGASRPGHFDGVATVVVKLINLVRPDAAVFGKKDYQQLAVIRRVVRDLDVQVEVIGCETVREPDGLAMSSRNHYLDPGLRAQAPAIRASLLACRASGERSAEKLIARFRASLASAAPDSRIDYAEVVDAETLEPVGSVPAAGGGGGAVMAVAVFFGRARLIDNIELGGASGEGS